jgi:phosphate transport system substrate-binding protein
MTAVDRSAALIAGYALTVAALTACSSPSSTGTSSGPSSRSGAVTVAGSTAMLPLVKEASGIYQAEHKDARISVSGGGSATGIAQVAAKAIDVGDSDITAPTRPELVDHRVAVVGFAIVTNPSVGVKDLTRAQLRDVFSGAIENWNQAGGSDQKIVVVNRPRTSGTRAVFTKVVMGGARIAESGLVQDATGTAVSVVKQTPGAVSYVALSGITGGGVTVVSVDGVAPDEDAITAGRYSIWSYEHMFTNGEPKGEVAAFIRFVENRADLAKKNHFIAIGAMKVHETDR